MKWRWTSMLMYTIIAFVIVVTTLLTAKIIFINRYKRKLEQEYKRSEQFESKAKQLEQLIKGQTRRSSFRVDVHVDECHFKIVEAKRRKLGELEVSGGKGVIKDLSFDGLRMETPIDLPVKDAVTLSIQFTFEDKPFTFKGVLLRKEERVNEHSFAYGLRFTEADLRMKNEFNQLLLAKDLELRNKLLQQIG